MMRFELLAISSAKNSAYHFTIRIFVPDGRREYGFRRNWDSTASSTAAVSTVKKSGICQESRRQRQILSRSIKVYCNNKARAATGFIVAV
jgi:hypothetical protein